VHATARSSPYGRTPRAPSYVLILDALPDRNRAIGILIAPGGAITPGEYRHSADDASLVIP